MKGSSSNQKETCIDIIAQAFDNNPSVNISIGAGGDRAKKIHRLSAYAYTKALVRNGVYLSSNEKGVALIFQSEHQVFSLQELWCEIRFALSLSIPTLLSVLKREGYIKKHRLGVPHLYFWFFGVKKPGGDAAFEIKQQVFDLAEKTGLPILLETSVWRNVLVYQRYGFEIYHEWVDEGNSITLWFMKRG